MSHPVYHAQSSARLFGGHYTDYLTIHQFLDAPKSHFADFRHRAHRHHGPGIDEAIERFGATLTNRDGAPVSIRTVLEQHILEDCGRIPTLADWLELISIRPWMDPAQVNRPQLRDAPLPLTTDTQSRLSAKRFGGEPKDYLVIHTWMDATEHDFPDYRHRVRRHHSLGIFEAETRFGAAVVNSAGRLIPVRYLLEQHVLNRLGTIPTLAAWLSLLPRKSWMAHPTEVRMQTR